MRALSLAYMLYVVRSLACVSIERTCLCTACYHRHACIIASEATSLLATVPHFHPSMCVLYPACEQFSGTHAFLSFQTK
jgi:hypothetical protein